MEEHLLRPYAYAVNLDCTAKGYIQPSVKVQADELIEYHEEEMVVTLHEKAVVLLDRLVKELRNSGYKVATDIEEIKNGKD